MHFWRKMDDGCWQLKTCNGACADHGHPGLVGKAVQWTSLGWSVHFSLHKPSLKRGSAKCWERDQATNTSGIRIVPVKTFCNSVDFLKQWQSLDPNILRCIRLHQNFRYKYIDIYMCANGYTCSILFIHVLLSSEHVCSISNSLKFNN